MSEVTVLQRTLEDHEFCKEFDVFCQAQEKYATEQCRSALLQQPWQVESAAKWAAKSQVYSEIGETLREYVRTNL